MSIPEVMDRQDIGDILGDRDELHRLLLEQMQDGLYMVEQSRFIFVNQALADMLGYTVAELTGRPILDVVAPEYRDMAREISAMRLRGEKVPNAYQAKYLNRNGVTEIHVLLNIRLSRLKNGSPVTIGTVKDISERVQAENALRDREKQLHEAQRIGRVGHWRIDMQTFEVQGSDMLCEILGLPPEHGLRHIDQVFGIMHPDDRAEILERRKVSIAENKPYDFLYRVLRSDGETRIIRGQGRPYYKTDGSISHMFGIIQDITELKKIEEELLHERYRAESANQEKSNFLATMSHEIRTPLNAILGFSELMDTEFFGPLGDKRYAEYIHGIRKSAEHLLEIVSDILDVSTIEAGEHTLNWSRLNFREVIDESLQVVWAQAMDAGISLHSNLPDGLPEFVADRRAIKQILINLLGNAVKFTPSGGCIEIDVSLVSDKVQLSISDNGIGIPADILPDITRPFERGSQSPLKAKEGTGLGLAIVDALVVLHRGSLKIESDVDQGTTVRITLPLNGPASSAVGSHPDQSPAENSITTGGSQILCDLPQYAPQRGCIGTGATGNF